MSCDDIENEWMMMMNKSIKIKTGINYSANKKEREKKVVAGYLNPFKPI